MIESASIENFEGGIAPAVDPSDLPPGTAEDALDVDPRGLGRLRGRMDDLVVRSAPPAQFPLHPGEGVVIHCALKVGSERGVLILDNENRSIELMKGTGATIRPVPEEQRYEGRVLPGPFHLPDGGVLFAVEGAPPIYIGAVGAQMTRRPVSFFWEQTLFRQPPLATQGHLLAPSGDPGLESGYTYRWRASFLYDGFQEGPLAEPFLVLGNHRDISYLEMTIRLTKPGLLSRRATHLNIYRSQQALEESGREVGPESAYRLAMSVPFDRDLAAETEGVIEPWTNFALRIRDIGYEGGPFEEMAGYPEGMTDLNIEPVASRQAGPFFFQVGRATSAETKDLYLYRSLPGQPNVTNWATDYLALTEEPVAMAFHDGMLWAASERVLSVVDVTTLALVRTWEGVGAAGPLAMAVGPHGVFIAGPDTLWLVDASGPKRIGLPIERSGALPSWEDTAGDAYVAYDATLGLYVALRGTASGSGPFGPSVRGYLFDPEGPSGGRWWRVGFGGGQENATGVLGITRTPAGGTTILLDGETVVSPDPGVPRELWRRYLRLMAGSVRKRWSWRSHRAAFPTEGLDVKPYYLKVASEGLAPLPHIQSNVRLEMSYEEEDGEPGPSREGRRDFRRNARGLRPRARYVQLFLSGRTGEEEVNSISLVHRKLPPR